MIPPQSPHPSSLQPTPRMESPPQVAAHPGRLILDPPPFHPAIMLPLPCPPGSASPLRASHVLSWALIWPQIPAALPSAPFVSSPDVLPAPPLILCSLLLLSFRAPCPSSHSVLPPPPLIPCSLPLLSFCAPSSSSHSVLPAPPLILCSLLLLSFCAPCPSSHSVLLAVSLAISVFRHIFGLPKTLSRRLHP
ncbi:unnamed protein product [Closterium sp. Naga37s-1]|nr:unnamed protein product [Closterium sp. Naga37s-1]